MVEPEDKMYSSHLDQLEKSLPSPRRANELETALKEAFNGHIVEKVVGYIQFDQVSVDELADAFYKFPILVKSVLASVNVASRAVARDLQITLDTYKDGITEKVAAMLAGYIKPMLPKELAIPSLIELDRYFWTDKEMRAAKGNWEIRILKVLNQYSSSKITFKKRKFSYSDEEFELDAAYSPSGDEIKVGIDIKRIESPRDIHKRSDEIVNKASKFKAAYPKGQFYAVIYYPFPSEHSNVKSRLKSDLINGVYFAGESESSIEGTAKLLLGQARLLKP